jgi:hypothetical protein
MAGNRQAVKRQTKRRRSALQARGYPSRSHVEGTNERGHACSAPTWHLRPTFGGSSPRDATRSRRPQAPRDRLFELRNEFSPFRALVSGSCCPSNHDRRYDHLPTKQHFDRNLGNGGETDRKCSRGISVLPIGETSERAGRDFQHDCETDVASERAPELSDRDAYGFRFIIGQPKCIGTTTLRLLLGRRDNGNG